LQETLRNLTSEDLFLHTNKIEIVISDNCSDDDTQKICENFVAEFPDKIRYFRQEFDIKDNLGDVISSYSHGMRQKLVLISALVHAPKFLVLDEPFVGLDPIASHNLKEIMKEFCANGGAIFFSSHVLEVVEKLCDRIGIIKKGKLVAQGTMQEIAGDKSLESLFV
jgi:ABC-2 type transport system ATP-binding protein